MMGLSVGHFLTVSGVIIKWNGILMMLSPAVQTKKVRVIQIN
jgi:hypothetical protein